MRFLIAIAFLIVAAAPGKANERPVNEAERAKLTPAITAQGCSGGKMEWDEEDRHFEVDDAVCDGRKYDLKFDQQHRLISKKVDD
jgi:hypothetical protein